MSNVSLPPGFTLRSAAPSDLLGVLDLIHVADQAEGEEDGFSVEDLLHEWQRPGFNLETDAWVVEAHEGAAPITEAIEAGAPGLNALKRPRIVGYEEVWNRQTRLQGDGYVHPRVNGLGVGTALLRRMEQRACEFLSEGQTLTIRNALHSSDQAGRRRHAAEGYQVVRYFYRMSIELDATPPAPVLPDELYWRTFDPANDPPQHVYAAEQEAFADHWGHLQPTFDDWRAHRLDNPSFDPSLWLLAVDGGHSTAAEIAAGALGRVRTGSGWISSLFVRRPWRRKGIGLALLHQAFGEFYRRGIRLVELSVDATSPTGATLLYERAGMRVTHEYILYEKELKP